MATLYEVASGHGLLAVLLAYRFPQLQAGEVQRTKQKPWPARVVTEAHLDQFPLSPWDGVLRPASTGRPGFSSTGQFLLGHLGRFQSVFEPLSHSLPQVVAVDMDAWPALVPCLALSVAPSGSFDLGLGNAWDLAWECLRGSKGSGMLRAGSDRQVLKSSSSTGAYLSYSLYSRWTGSGRTQKYRSGASSLSHSTNLITTGPKTTLLKNVTDRRTI